jgi:hypothetical protein
MVGWIRKRDNSNLNIDIYFSIIQLKWICINKCDRDTHPKQYIFMIRVTRQIKCLIAQALSHIYLWSGWMDKWNAPRVEAWGHPHPIPEVFFIAEYKTRPNDFDLQLVLVSCPKGQVKKKMLM